jgi:membrane protein implicated in regulation of membrane protease activity
MLAAATDGGMTGEAWAMIVAAALAALASVVAAWISHRTHQSNTRDHGVVAAALDGLTGEVRDVKQDVRDVKADVRSLKDADRSQAARLDALEHPADEKETQRAS